MKAKTDTQTLLNRCVAAWYGSANQGLSRKDRRGYKQFNSAVIVEWFLDKLSAELRLGFTVLEQIRDALVQARDGLDKLLKSRGFAGQFVACEARRYCLVGLSGAPNALRKSEKRARYEGITQSH